MVAPATVLNCVHRFGGYAFDNFEAKIEFASLEDLDFVGVFSVTSQSGFLEECLNLSLKGCTTLDKRKVLTWNLKRSK